jgi:hypothetical protein
MRARETRDVALEVWRFGGFFFFLSLLVEIIKKKKKKDVND